MSASEKRLGQTRTEHSVLRQRRPATRWRLLLWDDDCAHQRSPMTPDPHQTCLASVSLCGARKHTHKSRPTARPGHCKPKPRGPRLSRGEWRGRRLRQLGSPGSDWRPQWQRALSLMVVTSKAMLCTLQTSQTCDRVFGLRWWRLMAHLSWRRQTGVVLRSREARCPIKTSSRYIWNDSPLSIGLQELLAFSPCFFSHWLCFSSS
jgi:hypothetical protein